MNPSTNRRTLIAASAGLAMAATAVSAAKAAPPNPQPNPLPFDPKAVPGLSEKLLTAATTTITTPAR